MFLPVGNKKGPAPVPPHALKATALDTEDAAASRLPCSASKRVASRLALKTFVRDDCNLEAGVSRYDIHG